MNLRAPVYAEEIVLKNFPKDCKRVLDFGSGDGYFTQQLTRYAEEVHGCDIDTDVLREARRKSKDVEYRIVKPKGQTPYLDKFFDCITMIGVLEHVPEERETLKELYRILSPEGTLFIYVLNKGLLRFLDTANIKFISPRLHRFLYSLFFGKKEYKKEFIDKKQKGMFGDFSQDKKWHTHYSIEELKTLLGRNFTVCRIWYYSLFLPILYILDFLYIRAFRRSSKLVIKLIKLDSRINLGPLSYSLVIECKKN